MFVGKLREVFSRLVQIRFISNRKVRIGVPDSLETKLGFDFRVLVSGRNPEVEFRV